MGKRPKRRIILFLVEGKSDREALQIVISELYEKIDESIEVFFPIIHNDNGNDGGDITSLFGVQPKNIEVKIYDLFLRDFFDENKILPKDITEIIQIVDTDGVFIPDSAILLGDNPNGEDRPYYSSTAIICSDTERIKKRNLKKRENLNHLCSLSTIKVKQKTVPYSVYYFSSNLDHFIHNDANLQYQKKCNLAERFANGFIGKPMDFINYFSENPEVAKGVTYETSWNFIKQDLNSLQRHTNINLLFDKLI